MQANEEVLIHCVAGRHRAAGLAILTRALQSGTSIAERHQVVRNLRDIEFDKLVEKRHVSEWIASTTSSGLRGSAAKRIGKTSAVSLFQLPR